MTVSFLGATVPVTLVVAAIATAGVAFAAGPVKQVTPPPSVTVDPVGTPTRIEPPARTIPAVCSAGYAPSRSTVIPPGTMVQGEHAQMYECEDARPRQCAPGYSPAVGVATRDPRENPKYHCVPQSR